MKTHRIFLIINILVCSFSVQLWAGGFIIVQPPGTGLIPPGFNPYQLEIKSLKIESQINEQTAKTFIEQVFYNPSMQNLEGYFIFPVPPGAIISDFSMEVNGTPLEAELLEADEARKYYEDIVRKYLDPALLEYSEQNLFKVRIFPIEARAEKRINISYTQVLEKDNSTYEYVLPLRNQKHATKPVKSLTITANIANPSELKTIYSPTHEVDIVRSSDKSAMVSYEAENVKETSDFKLYISTDNARLGMSLLPFMAENDSNDGFFMLTLSPGFGAKSNPVVEKDITFVLDVSGSMAGEKLEQAKKALTFCIDNLNRSDRFEIIKFSTQAKALFGERSAANSANVDKAKTFVDELRPIGGTNMDAAFELAMKEKASQNRPHFVIFITDGKPTVSETEEEPLISKIKKYNTENTRIFTFGIGTEINTHLLDRITEETRAFRSYITPGEDIETKISSFYTKVSSPVLTDVEISFSQAAGVYDVFPSNYPDIFQGSSLTLFGRFRNTGRLTVTVEGKINGETEKLTYRSELKTTEQYEFVPALWASRHIGYLLDQIRLHGENDELKDEVIRLAKQYGIITPYTSYLILEDEALSLSRREIPDDVVIFNNRSANNNVFMEQNRAEFEQIAEEDGAGAVRSSDEVQKMTQATTISASQQGRARMNYVDKNGDDKNFADEVRNIQGRAVYQNGNEWIDLYVQTNTNLPVQRIKFASNAYFRLIEKEPETTDFLSLGRNVRFVHNQQVYEIYE